MSNDTDLCVKCGLCNPHCPTYFVSKNEADSPRGRISLIQGMAQQALTPSKNLIQHLDSCLQCLACEKACPSQVPYGQIIHAAKTALPKNTKTRFIQFITKPTVLTKLMTVRRAATTLPQFLQPKKLKALLVNTAPVSKKQPIHQQPVSEAKTLLLQGCLTSELDAQTIIDAQRVFDYLGLSVALSDQCCGSLNFHQGNTTAASQQAKALHISGQGYDNILYISTGCGAFIQQYKAQYPEYHLGQQLIDLSDFLLKQTFPANDTAPAISALIHTPCSAKNQLNNGDVSTKLLSQFNNIVQTNMTTTYCCGGAGQYSLQQPDIAQALINEQLTHLPTPLPEYLVTTNIGCALQFTHALAYHGIDITVLHPISLIAIALGLTDSKE